MYLLDQDPKTVHLDLLGDCTCTFLFGEDELHSKHFCRDDTAKTLNRPSAKLSG